MSSYIIAGSADSIDTAYCEQIARRIKAKYKNIDFRIVIKHPSQWQEYLQQICRIYGFLKKSNPIIYTFDGKIIGNKQAFMASTARYFGLDQSSLVVNGLSNEVNMKIATSEINKKHITKNSIKTLNEKIDQTYDKLLKKGILKHQLKSKQEYMTNGIEYIHRKVPNVVPTMNFNKTKEIPVLIEQIKASDIDLMTISLNDQIKVQQANNTTHAGNPAFVTSNNQQPGSSNLNIQKSSQNDRMSEVSRTNKMHESNMSYDKDSKQMKQSSKSKSRIDEENDDVTDYIDLDMGELRVCQLGDDFCVAYVKGGYIDGQMVFYKNQEEKENGVGGGVGGVMRVYNDNRPVNGHRVLIKEVHFDGVEELVAQGVIVEGQAADEPQGETQRDETVKQDNKDKPQGQKQADQVKPTQSDQKKDTEINTPATGQSDQKPSAQVKVQEQASKIPQKQQPSKTNQNNVKSRTQPNIPQHKQGLLAQQNINNNQDEIFSQIHNSDLNLISHLNYHTLYIQKPLSNLQLKNILHFISQTQTIGCLQFLGENPNPKLKLYDRMRLLGLTQEDLQNSSTNKQLPIERFINKQLQDEEYQTFTLPNETCYDYQPHEKQQKFEMLKINDIGYEHYIYRLQNDPTEDEISIQLIAKMIKHSIDSLLSRQVFVEQLKKDIGYNLIFTDKIIMIVPLCEPYEVYAEKGLYLDGLAYLGFVHTADLVKGYQLNKGKSSLNLKGKGSAGQELRKLLGRCASGKEMKE